MKTTNVDQFKNFGLMKSHLARTLTLFYSSMAKKRGYEVCLKTSVTLLDITFVEMLCLELFYLYFRDD